jgi:hypothetical protein
MGSVLARYDCKGVRLHEMASCLSCFFHVNHDNGLGGLVRVWFRNEAFKIALLVPPSGVALLLLRCQRACWVGGAVAYFTSLTHWSSNQYAIGAVHDGLGCVYGGTVP